MSRGDIPRTQVIGLRLGGDQFESMWNESDLAMLRAPAQAEYGHTGAKPGQPVLNDAWLNWIEIHLGPFASIRQYLD